MSRKLTLVKGIICAALALSGCGGNKTAPNGDQATANNPVTAESQATAPSAKEIARNASEGIGNVTQSSSDVKGIPVLALEERHNSRVGQLQHAITLIRLHEKYGLKDIVLEGFLKERPAINTGWFTKAILKKTPAARSMVAVQFLKQGEISAAEFMKLVYEDITLYQAETSATYNVVPPARFAVVDYLKAIGEVDPAWANEKSKPYQSLESFQRLSGDEKLRLAEEIKQYAESRSISVSSDAKQAMEEYIAFMQKRLSSNKVISETVATVASGAVPKVIAINIGADHTHGMVQLLKDANRPYAVISPLYTPGRAENGDLTGAMYDRKNQKLPVFSQGLSALVLREVSRGKKPEPVLAEQWFEAEAEFYGYVTSLSEAVLGPLNPPGPPNGGRPPFGFLDDDFDGAWVKIALANVQYLANQPGKGSALLIPVTFKRSGKTVWVGATLKHGEEKGQGNVEAIVTHALQEVQAERNTPERAEDQTGHIQMSINTFSIMGEDRETVRRAVLSEI